MDVQASTPCAPPCAPPCGRTMVYMLGTLCLKTIIHGLRLMCVDMCVVDMMVSGHGCSSSVSICVEEKMTGNMAENYHEG